MRCFLLVARHFLGAAICVRSPCVPGRALTAQLHTGQQSPEYTVVLRMQAEPEQASFLLLLAGRASEPVVCDCPLQPNSAKSYCKDDSALKQEISKNSASTAPKILELYQQPCVPSGVRGDLHASESIPQFPCSQRRKHACRRSREV